VYKFIYCWLTLPATMKCRILLALIFHIYSSYFVLHSVFVGVAIVLKNILRSCRKKTFALHKRKKEPCFWTLYSVFP